MNGRTLLLNRDYLPLRTISWQHAMVKLYLGKVEIVEEYDEHFVHTPVKTLKMPAVVRLLGSFGWYQPRLKFCRQNVLIRDQLCCQYCGVKKKPSDLQLEHVIPKSRGGKTSWRNVVAACSSCNKKKANRTPEEAGMKLLSEPYQPVWNPVWTPKVGTIPPIWRAYCNWGTARF